MSGSTVIISSYSVHDRKYSLSFSLQLNFENDEENFTKS